MAPAPWRWCQPPSLDLPHVPWPCLVGSGPTGLTVAALGCARLLPPLGFKLLHVPFALPGELFLREGGSWLISLWVSIQMPHRPPHPGESAHLTPVSSPSPPVFTGFRALVITSAYTTYMIAYFQSVTVTSIKFFQAWERCPA